MRLPATEHTSRPWRIHEIAHDFELEDVWALPTPGGPDDFPRLLEMATALDPEQGSSPIVRALFAVRWKLGGLLGWDDDRTGLGARVSPLRDRLPADLRDGARPPTFAALPFEPLYVTDCEYAGEIANATMHGVIHLGWVEDAEHGGWRGQMAVLVQRNGLLGSAYMFAIRPFRYTLVYPAMLREFGRAWTCTRIT